MVESGPVVYEDGAADEEEEEEEEPCVSAMELLGANGPFKHFNYDLVCFILFDEENPFYFYLLFTNNNNYNVTHFNNFIYADFYLFKILKVNICFLFKALTIKTKIIVLM